MVQDAVVHCIQITGEAARNVSADFRQAHPEIPWADMIGMRNRVVHEYLGVDLDVVWSTVRTDLPRLVRVIDRLLQPGPELES
ncbi:hypothetical protein caldi_08420 [Caldinitratiruptor microaerophilus]|uniref:DUF86 domain-containing protein n=2 Tax=Caldinitratiruptor microaerophilus TaxID=671077 RepID=A0AA35CIQ4_9FIRM|nr:hypothetical protein caldi_08420 [Caldinitratiruptor microaerophilus]